MVVILGSRCKTRVLHRLVKLWCRQLRTRQFPISQLYPPTTHHHLVASTQYYFLSCKQNSNGTSNLNAQRVDNDCIEDEGIAKELDSQLYLKPNDEQQQEQVKPISSISGSNISADERLLAEDEAVWSEQKIDYKKMPGIYLRLSKYRLSALVVLTAVAGYTMAPGPFIPSTLLFGCVGTALFSASANAFNQWIEVPFDSQMARTRNRVIVRNQISSLHAAVFGVVTGITGSLILFFGVNSLTAALGIFNMLLYTSVYTPLKRISILNTWVGAIVGAVPPLMGWAACSGSLSISSLVMGGILYAWQFPHFNALSWGLRADYSRGGYQMMSVVDPDLCRRVALRYCIGLIPICTLAPVTGLTSWWFALDSLPLNAWFTYLGWKFYKHSDFKSARKLFHFSLFHLPLVMILLILNKQTE